MKRTIILLSAIALIAVLGFISCAKEESALEEAAAVETTQETVEWGRALPEPETMLERFSYAFGYLFTQSYVQDGLEFDVDYFSMAMNEALQGEEGYYSQEQINEILMEFQTLMMEEETAAQAEVSSANLEEADTFLAANKGRDGIITTESGLQYEVLVEGDGVKPTASDVVTVHYEGSLVNGLVFESSYEGGNPATFALGGVIPGWVEGLQLMNVGSKYRLFLHPDLAYGEAGSPPVIEPNKMLIFEVELLSIGE